MATVHSNWEVTHLSPAAAFVVVGNAVFHVSVGGANVAIAICKPIRVLAVTVVIVVSTIVSTILAPVRKVKECSSYSSRKPCLSGDIRYICSSEH